jgi:hypothetical protein
MNKMTKRQNSVQNRVIEGTKKHIKILKNEILQNSTIYLGRFKEFDHLYFHKYYRLISDQHFWEMKSLKRIILKIENER